MPALLKASLSLTFALKLFVGVSSPLPSPPFIFTPHKPLIYFSLSKAQQHVRAGWSFWNLICLPENCREKKNQNLSNRTTAKPIANTWNSPRTQTRTRSSPHHRKRMKPKFVQRIAVPYVILQFCIIRLIKWKPQGHNQAALPFIANFAHEQGRKMGSGWTSTWTFYCAPRLEVESTLQYAWLKSGNENAV